MRLLKSQNNHRSFLSYLLKKGPLSSSRAFALPTVLIVSIVMLMVLAVGVSATAATRDNLLVQYYDQLAQVAGDAGNAYAKACLAANGNIATWSNSAPLTPNTNCSGTPVGGYPTYVSSLNDIRSTFSVGAPTTDTNGRAVTIPNSGMTQLLRTSTQVVWKTYFQPAAQAAVVPDLCSGLATSALGWNNAAIASSSYTIPDSQAAAISISSAAINPGPVYFRKDFTVTTAGTYTITAAETDNAAFYLDGVLFNSNTSTTPQSLSFPLTAGCHTLAITLTKAGIIPAVASFKASLKLSGASTPIVVSDTSWRVSAGNTVHYSSPNYYEDTSTWGADRDFGLWNNTNLPWGGGPAGWNTASGDNNSQYVTTWANASGNNYPGNQYTWLRNTRGFNMSATGDVKISTYCDDNCTVYLDGTQVLNNTSGSGLVSTTITVQAGNHDFGVMLYNNSGANVSAMLFAAVKVSDGTVLMRSDQNWDAANFWSATPTEYYSYDKTFVPNPNSAQTTSQTVKVLVIGGGGGGAGSGSGGGAGGYQYSASLSLSAGIYPIIVGSGGAGGGAGLGGTPVSAGFGGRDSSFLSLTAYGGGYGTGHGDPGGGGPGGSGGGGAIMTATTVPTGGKGTAPQGSMGGNGYLDSGWAGGTGGGGGAGGAGNPGNNSPGSGNGGVGLLNTITGSAVYYAGGGGGAEINGSYVGTGGSGGGGGAGVNAAGASGTANTGGGGAGGSYGGSGTNCSGSYCGGGNGGSGVVIISYPTGSMTTFGGSVTTSGSNTIVTYTGSGLFYVNAATPTAVKTASAKVLLVGGGGSGGGGYEGGGGGGGGYVYDSNHAFAVGAYPVAVGAGGTGGSYTTFYDGLNSSVDSLVAQGGGSGAGEGVGGTQPQNGGSGGGGAHPTQTLIGFGVLGQGNNGGVGLTGNPYVGAGGGGAGGVGTNASTSAGGAGGVGVVNPITGSTAGQLSGGSYYVGGGGGGGLRGGNGGAGGLGGGAAAASASVGTTGSSATANTGGGGGSGQNGGNGGVAGSGGSGVVVIAYLTGSMTTTGGSVTTSGAYTIVTFTAAGTFNVTSIAGSTYVAANELLVAGGGGGAASGAGGGGGGGGVVSTTASISSAGSYTVTVGGGGSGGVGGTLATNGGSSSALGYTAIGGGAGAWDNGYAGGSGGGSGRGAGTTSNFGAGTVGQGYNGGTAGYYSGQYPAAGGGGAGGVGGSVTSASPGSSGNGGVGLPFTISGASVTYAGGGGGGGDYCCSRNLGPGSGGLGGGAAGGNSVALNGSNGTANTGGGGGGATQSSSGVSGNGGNGGSGIVIISFVTGTMTLNTIATTGAVTTSGANTIVTFTSSGTFAISSIP